MQKKSQAAMEFLMTYGWAILVVLIVIGALAYFGVLKATNFLPEKCEMPVSLNCKNYIIKTNASSEGTISFEIVNGGGNDIKVTKILAENRDFFKTNCSNISVGGKLIKNGYSAIFYLTDSQGEPNDDCEIDSQYAGSSEKTKWDITLTWYPATSSSQFAHTSNGELLAKVEKE